MSEQVVGQKTAWQLWAESAKEERETGGKLIKEGWFTLNDFMKQTGWGRGKCRCYLDSMKHKLKPQKALDPRVRQQRWFYFPPSE